MIKTFNIQIRGTSGSGKSTLMKKLIDFIDTKYMEPVYLERPKTAHHYDIVPEEGRNYSKHINLVGPYHLEHSGGLDLLGKEERKLPNLYAFYVANHHKSIVTISEGIMQSEDTKWTMELIKEVPTRIVYLNTPIDECLRRIDKRRKAQGNERPLNRKKTIDRMGTIERARLKLMALKSTNLKIYKVNCANAFHLIKSWL